MQVRLRGRILLLGIAAFLFLLSNAALAGPGKFYIVGMGTTPDLLTLRGAEVVKRADIILLEDPGDQETWEELIGNKEVWSCPRRSAVSYGADLENLKDLAARERAMVDAKILKEIVERIRGAVEKGKTVAALKWGDPMMYENTFYLEMMPEDFPSEIVPGVGSFQAASAALKRSPCYGWDTNSVILTMVDWPGRTDNNEKLMATQTTMVFYAMHLDYLQLFEQLGRHYAKDTPVAVVSHAGDLKREEVIRSTVGRFLAEVNYRQLPPDATLLLVGRFLTAGQARKEAALSQPMR